MTLNIVSKIQLDLLVIMFDLLKRFYAIYFTCLQAILLIEQVKKTKKQKNNESKRMKTMPSLSLSS